MANLTELLGPAPCRLCGYNGQGYFNSNSHPCVKLVEGNNLNFRRPVRPKRNVPLSVVDWLDENGEVVDVWTLPDGYLQNLERFMAGWGANALPEELDVRLQRLLPFYYVQVVMEMTRRELRPLPPHPKAVREALNEDMRVSVGIGRIRSYLNNWLPTA